MYKRVCTYVVLLLAAAVSACGGGHELLGDTQRKPLSTTTSATYSRDDLYRFFVVAFGAAPGVTYMGQAAAAAEGGASVRQIVNAFTTKSQFLDTYPASLSDLAFAQKLTENVVGASATAASKSEAVQDIVGALKSPGMTRCDIVYIVFNNLANMPAVDPKWGKTAAKMANQVAYAKHFTEVLKDATTDLNVLRQAVSSVDELTTAPWSLTKISPAGVIESQSKSANACGSYDIVTRGDLNNDGHDDIVIGPKAWYKPTMGCSDAGFTKPIVAFYNAKSKIFEVDGATQLVMPEMQWMHNAYIADFNGDGYADLFAVGTGTDAGQPCGEAPILLLGTPSGLVDKSHLLPRFASYSHQAAWGDFNGDGKTDFVILNNNWVPTQPSDPKYSECWYRRHPGSNESWLILSSGDSWKFSALRINDKSGKALIDGNQSFNSATAGDINNDGKTDLVVVGSNWGSLAQQTLTFMGDGMGGFSLGSVFVERPFGDNTVGAKSSLRQLDGNGPLELLINYAEHPGGPEKPFQNSLYRIFSFNTSTLTWSNLTDQFMYTKKSMETDLTFCAQFYWVDLNSDSKDDFVCTTINPIPTSDPAVMSPRLWLRGPDSKFTPAYHQGIDLTGKLASPTPVRVDGKIKIVGMSTNSYRGPIRIDIAE